MMDTRAAATEALRHPKTHKALLGGYIQEEELRACTTCQACIEACPVQINPMQIILDLRRFLVLEEGKAPEAWQALFSHIETTGAPWKLPAGTRMAWAKDIKNPTSS